MTAIEFENFLRDSIHNNYRSHMYFPQNVHKYYELPKDKYVMMSLNTLSLLLADKVRSGHLTENLFPGENKEYEEVLIERGVNGSVIDLVRKDKEKDNGL